VPSDDQRRKDEKMIFYDCKTCGAHLGSPPDMQGKPDPCPDCGTANIVPVRSSPPPRKAPRPRIVQTEFTPIRRQDARATGNSRAGGLLAGLVYLAGFAFGLCAMMQMSGLFDAYLHKSMNGWTVTTGQTTPRRPPAARQKRSNWPKVLANTCKALGLRLSPHTATTYDRLNATQ